MNKPFIKDGVLYVDGINAPEITKNKTDIQTQQQELQKLSNTVDILIGQKRSIFHYNSIADSLSYIESEFDEENNLRFYLQVQRAILPIKYNSCLNFSHVALVNKISKTETIVHSCSDDIAPGNWNGSYIGANHGFDNMRECTAVEHNKTYVDIGSKWECNGKIYTIIGIEFNKLFLLGENTREYPLFSMNTAPVGTYTHVSGATHTESFTVTESVLKQMYNQTRPCIFNIIADDKEITESGDYEFNDLKICETYDVINQADTLKEIQRLVGTFTSNPIFTELDNINTTVKHASIYHFKNAATWFLNVSFIAQQQISLGYFGFTQQLPLSGDIKMYIPKALPISNGEETLDFRTIVPYNRVPQTMNINTSYWENPNLPPDRWLEYSDKIGLASGYLFDYGVGGTNRKDNVKNAFFLYTSRKCYPYGIDGSATNITAGTIKSAVVFRRYINPQKINKNGIILVDSFEYNNKLYIYADFNQIGLYNIKIPTKYLGKKINVFEKSNNVEVLNTIATSIIQINVNINNPMYGYVVISINY